MQIYFITDRKLRQDRPLVEIVGEAARAGVEQVQMREKDLPGRELFRLAESLREVCRPAGCSLLVNDRLDVALAAGADGVHLPADGLPAAAVRQAVGKRFRIGVSTHSPEEAIRAEAAGADFVVFGPLFPTPAKLQFGSPLGIEPLREVLKRVALPVFAVGGIDTGTIEPLRDLSLAGVAVIRALLLARDIPETVGKLRG